MNRLVCFGLAYVALTATALAQHIPSESVRLKTGVVHMAPACAAGFAKTPEQKDFPNWYYLNPRSVTIDSANKALIVMFPNGKTLTFTEDLQRTPAGLGDVNDRSQTFKDMVDGIATYGASVTILNLEDEDAKSGPQLAYLETQTTIHEKKSYEDGYYDYPWCGTWVSERMDLRPFVRPQDVVGAQGLDLSPPSGELRETTPAPAQTSFVGLTPTPTPAASAEPVPDLASQFERAWKRAASGVIDPRLFLGLILGALALFAALLWQFWPRSLDRRIKRTKSDSLRQSLMREQEEALRDEIRLTHSAAARMLAGMNKGIWFALTIAGFAAGYGIYLMFTDPHDPEYVRVAESVVGAGAGSILTSMIWGLLLKLTLVAPTFVSRLVRFAVVSVPALAFTAGLSTALGLAGLGGPHAQQLDMLTQVDVLQHSLTEDALRAGTVEAQVLPALLQIENSLSVNAKAEVDQGAVCKAGEGPLFRFYTDRDREASLLIAQVKAAGQRGLPDISVLRKRIAEPDGTFRSMRYVLSGELEAARQQVALVFDQPSYIAAMTALRDQLAAVGSDAFFAGWQQCQLSRKPLVQRQTQAIVSSLDGLIQAVRDGKKTAGARIVVPEFTLRNELISVLDHRAEVPYQIAFQVGLDLVPFLIVLIAVFFLPLPEKRRNGDVVINDNPVLV